MDTLDTIAARSAQAADAASAYGEDLIDETESQAADLAATAEEKVEEVKEAVSKINWWQVAGFAAAGIAAAGAYAYWRNQQRPQTRLERLRDQLGLSAVDFRHLRSTAHNFDLEKLNQSRRQLGAYAKKATHKGATRIAELTR